MGVVDKRLGDIFIEAGDELVNIRDLERVDYERFLERVNALRLVYIVSMRKVDNGDEVD